MKEMSCQLNESKYQKENNKDPSLTVLAKNYAIPKYKHSCKEITPVRKQVKHAIILLVAKPYKGCDLHFFFKCI